MPPLRPAAKRQTSRMKFKRKIGLILLACALVLCVIGVKWLFFTPPAVSSYLTAPVSVADIEDTVLASGAIQAARPVIWPGSLWLLW